MDKCSRNKERLMEDVDILMESATQTTFLYNLAYQLFLRFGKEIEIKSISIFIRALTSDINEYEAAKRNKSSKHSMENKLTRGFWLLRYLGLRDWRGGSFIPNNIIDIKSGN